MCVQVVFVDGNGILHPRGFGAACHIGVLANLPTVGVGKTLHFVDGITSDAVRTLCAARLHRGGDWCELRGDSGRVWGAVRACFALRCLVVFADSACVCMFVCMWMHVRHCAVPTTA